MITNPLEKIKNEASRCLNCSNAPCKKACPLSNDIPAFVRALACEDDVTAGKIVASTNPFGAICGVVCPHEKQCQGACVLNKKGQPIQIGMLEEFAFHYGFDGFTTKSSLLEGKRVAVVGSGVAGLTCAIYLAQQGAKARIFEKDNVMGGVVQHEIPSFRLKKQYIIDLIYYAKQIGVQFARNVYVGKKEGYSLGQLSANFDAVFVATGLSLDSKLGINGENLCGVRYGKEFLQNPHVGANVVVIGGGNVAMDCARTAKQLGANVVVAYRRTYNEMPAFDKEKQDALSEGVQFAYLLSPHQINGDDAVQSVIFEKMALDKMGEDGRRGIVATGQYENLCCDTVVIATGSKFDSTVLTGTNVQVNKGRVVVDTNHNAGDNLFFGGDVTNREGTVVWAVKDGLDAGKSITQFLTQQSENDNVY